MNAVTKTGVVKWFDSKKGFGFITLDDQSGDIFVHYSAISQTGFRNLVEGQQVSLSVVTSPKGLQAENVIIL